MTDAAVGPDKSADAVSSASVGADDDGVVSLSQSQPVEGETVSATLTDPDGDVTGTTWQWETSPNGDHRVDRHIEGRLSKPIRPSRQMLDNSYGPRPATPTQ